MKNFDINKNYLLLSGGVGGSKLAYGLSVVLPESSLTVCVNTGDDFEYLGLMISPDIDTMIYNLSGLNDPVRGWGRSDETWSFMSVMNKIGNEYWFMLGDKDLAMHVERTRRIKMGQTLSEVTQSLSQSFNIKQNVCPMTDHKVATYIKTEDKVFDFQTYFVKEKCLPKIKEISFDGSVDAMCSDGVKKVLYDKKLNGIIFSPSNPYISIGPILAIDEISRFIMKTKVPVVAVSPLIGHKALKGPTAKMMQEMGNDVSVLGIVEIYKNFIDGIIIDETDSNYRNEIESKGLSCHISRIEMNSSESKEKLAKEVLVFLQNLSKSNNIT